MGHEAVTHSLEERRGGRGEEKEELSAQERQVVQRLKNHTLKLGYN